MKKKSYNEEIHTNDLVEVQDNKFYSTDLLPSNKRMILKQQVANQLYTTNYVNFTMLHFQERVGVWLDTIRGFTLLGNGVGSFEITYPLKAIHIDTSLARPQHAHNDLLELVFELGVGVLILIPMFWNILKVKTDEKAILCSIFVISLFSFPLYVPVIGFIWLLFSGHIARNGSDSVRWNESGYLFLKRN